MDNQDLAQVMTVIAQCSSFGGASWPFLDLLRQFASDGKLQAFAEAYDQFAGVFPAQRVHVQSAIPAIILNWYLMKSGSTPAPEQNIWNRRAAKIVSVLSTPSTFEMLVNDARDDLLAGRLS